MKHWSCLVFATTWPLVCALPQAAGPGAGDLPRATAPFKADIRADTNRDGRVDVQGTTNVAGKDTWTDQRSAPFLANVADQGGRCMTASVRAYLESTRKILDRPLPDHNRSQEKNERNARLRALRKNLEELSRCHDASDDVQRAPQNMASVRTLPVQGLSASASGSISVSDDTARSLVRVFRPRGDDDWEIVTSDTTFSADDLARGLQLGVDARDVRRPNVWDGRARITFTITDGDKTSADSVALRVAPVLTNHHGQKIQRVYTTNTPGTAPRNTRRDLRSILGEARIQDSIVTLNTRLPWAQDIFEPAYTSMPGPNGTVAIQLLVDSAVIRRLGTNILTYTSSRDSGLGTVQYYGNGRGPEALDFMGNLEMIPPHEHNGNKYPAGRIITGGNEATGDVAFVIDFFRAQEVQSPLVADLRWLSVQHIYEFVQFLPAKTQRGWCVMISDPKAGFEIVKHAQEQGAGKSPVISKPGGEVA